MMSNCNDDFKQASSINASESMSLEKHYYQNLTKEGSDRSHGTPTSSLPAAIVDVGSHTACPASLLNYYGADLRQRQHQSSKSPNSPFFQHQHQDQHLDESFRVIDFLFGNSSRINQFQTSSSLTEGVIQILDQYFLNCASMNNKCDASSNTTVNTSTGSNIKKRRGTNCIDTISRMESPAGRSLYLVSKGAKSGKKRCNENTNSTKQDTSSHYLCLLSDEIPVFDNSPSSSPPHLSYCSCRSFLERTRTTLPNERISCDRSMILCKHLLAIKLLPVFGTALGVASEHSNDLYIIPTKYFASEEDFSRAITQRLSK